jgi:integrative and conjugative element protein (TIGR02256 family)
MNRLFLAPDLGRRFIQDASRHRPLETGGVLLGRRTEDGARLVTYAIDAGDQARRTRTSFEPDYRWQQARMLEVYDRLSDLEYLGDWHSHPGGRAFPSRTDVTLLASIRAATMARCPDPVIVILGGRRQWRFRAFELDDRERLRGVDVVSGPTSSIQGFEESFSENLRLLAHPPVAHVEQPDRGDHSEPDRDR